MGVDEVGDTATMLREQPIRKVFFKYLIPSTLGLLLLSINIVIDGIFIGHGVGPDGLAAVNIAVPIYSFFYGIALWVGVGGATLYSIYIGKGKVSKAKQIFTLSFTTAIVSTLFVSFISLLFMEQLAYFFGANDVIIDLVLDYMFILLLFGLVFVLESMLSVFIRNDGNPILAMTALIIAAIGNVILNYLFIFVFHWGVRGAALATVLATFIAFIVMLAHFFRKSSTLSFQSFTFDKLAIRDIVTIGFPSFISEISIAIVTFGYNVLLMKFVGELGVAAFSIVNYLHSMAALMFIGIGSALQPLVSFYYGAKLSEKMQQSLRFAVITALIFGVGSFLIGILLAGPLTLMFNATENPLYTMTVNGIYLFFINYLFLGFNLVYATYYQSIGKVKLALIITVTRSILLVVLFLVTLPIFFGTTGIWLAVPLAEAITVLLVLYIRNQNTLLQEA